jgi:hypothetical protein
MSVLQFVLIRIIWLAAVLQQQRYHSVWQSCTNCQSALIMTILRHFCNILGGFQFIGFVCEQ